MKNNIISQSFSINLSVMRFLGSLNIIYILSAKNLDILQLNFSAAYLTEVACFTAKLLPFIRNGQHIKMCINYFANPCFIPHGDKQKNIIDECSKICRRNTMVYLIVVTCAAITWIVKPFFFKGTGLPLDIWLPYDATAGPKYWITFVFIAVASTYDAFSGTLIDPLIGGLACQAAGQLRVLKYNLEHLNEIAKMEIRKKGTTLFEEKSVKFENMYARIRECIEHHNAILMLVCQFYKI
ncbi:7tm 6 domain containing protein [Asbolus verrucosus]|uniref:7tm 6 domain containing protein n=1 Tax=Asbolus verrucosus TaxID=1661398 RepID=A0A482V2E8_ASBVE|nr:7tm 6 domain containing protein [Asbolus verrucosus]